MTVAWLSDQAPALIDSFDAVQLELGDDAEDVVHVVALLRQVKQAVDAALNAQESRLASLLAPGEVLDIPGVCRVSVEVKPKPGNKHGAKLARVLAARVADRPANEDGEPFPPAVIAERAADECVQVFALDTKSTYIRAGELKKRGLRMGDYVEWEDGVPRLMWMEAG